MNKTTHKPKGPALVLCAATAQDLMTANPVSLPANASVREAVACFVDRHFGAAPVIDDAGRPIGVVSQSDIVTHDRENVEFAGARTEYYEKEELSSAAPEKLRTGFEVVDVDPTRVRDIMTPVVYAVRPNTPAPKVVSDMLAQNVHRLFVVDDAGILVGVISAVDILKHLRLESL